MVHGLIHALIHRLIHALIHGLVHALVQGLIHALIHRLVHALLVLAETGVLLETSVHSLIHRGIHAGLLVKTGTLAEAAVHSLVHAGVHPLIHARLLAETTLLETAGGLRLAETRALLKALVHAGIHRLIHALIHAGVHAGVHAGLLTKTALLGTETTGHCAAHPVHVSGDRAAGHSSTGDCTTGNSTAIIRLAGTLETTHSGLLLKTAGLLAVTAAHSTLLTKTTGLLAKSPLLTETTLRRAKATALRLESAGLLGPETALLPHSGIHAVTTADSIIAQRAKESNPL